MNFLRTGKLQRRAGRQGTLHNGPEGYILRQAGGLHVKLGCGNGLTGGLPFSATRPAVFRSPLDRIFMQPTGSPFCLLCSPPKINVFYLETRPSSLPISVIRGRIGFEIKRSMDGSISTSFFKRAS